MLKSNLSRCIVIDSEPEEVTDLLLPSALRGRRLQGPRVLPFGDDRQSDVLQECDASACAEIFSSLSPASWRYSVSAATGSEPFSLSVRNASMTSASPVARVL